MTDALADQVLAIVAAQARRPLSEVRAAQSPADLGLDSLNLVEMVFAIEEAFDITLPFQSREGGAGGLESASLASLIEEVRRLVAARAP